MQSQANKANSRMEMATFGGGCFWCLEAVFKMVNGVDKVESGFAGGHVINPNYYQVSRGDSGHAEVVQITYDPQVISYTDLLEIFFKIHDPTTVNRQGNDVGTQYRSIILAHNDNQRDEAQRFISFIEKSKLYSMPIVTEVKDFETFYRAESYHDNYYENHKEAPYCELVISPKVHKFKEEFANKLKL